MIILEREKERTITTKYANIISKCDQIYCIALEATVSCDKMQFFVRVCCPVGAVRWVYSIGLVSTVVVMELAAAGWEERSTASSPLHQQGGEEEHLKIAVESSVCVIE